MGRRRRVSVDPAQGRGQQQPPAAKLALKLGGKLVGPGIGLPGAAQVAEEGQAAQADGEADEQLEAEFQHGERCAVVSLGVLSSGIAAGVMLERFHRVPAAAARPPASGHPSSAIRCPIPCPL